MLIFENYENGDTSVILYDINTKGRTMLNDYKVKENIDSEFMGWYDNDRYMIKEQGRDETKYLLTKDFKNYDLLYTVPYGAYEKYSPDGNKLVFKRIYETLSPDGKKLILQDEKNKKLILYENGIEVWSTNQFYDRYLLSWSEDGRYVILTEQLTDKFIKDVNNDLTEDIEAPDVDGLLLFDTINKTIVKMNAYNEESIGVWAPNKGMFAYSITNTADATEKGIYIYDVEKQKLQKFSLSDINPILIEDLIWSPDGRYIAIIAMDAIYTYDTLTEQRPLKQQFKVDSYISIDKYKIRWSEDSKQILFTIRQTTSNFLKPADYYLAKVEINSGKIKKRFIRATLHDDLFKWLNDNEVIYTHNGNKLYRTKLIW